MAKPVSEEELQLKKRARRRLIGAIALVAGTAAVLPMVLDSEPKPTSQDINIQIPSPEVKGAITTKVVPAAPRPDKAAPAAKPDVASTLDAREEIVETKPPAPVLPKATEAKVPVKPVEKAADKSTEKAVERTAEKAAEKKAEQKPKQGTFFIQVVALAEADKARQVQQQIVDAGVRSYTEVVTAGTGKVTRVRAGPFATREDAERARTKLQGIGLEGKVAAN